MSKHPIVHIEIPAADQEVSGNFYRELFGWEIESYPEMQYMMFRAGDGPGGGLPKVDGETHKVGQPLVYVGSDDLDASLAKAAELGGTVVVPTSEIPGVGWFAIFTDPTGNRIALYKDAS